MRDLLIVPLLPLSSLLFFLFWIFLYISSSPGVNVAP